MLATASPIGKPEPVSPFTKASITQIMTMRRNHSTYLRLGEGGVPVLLDEHRFRAARANRERRCRVNVHAGAAVRAGIAKALRACAGTARAHRSV